MVRGYSFKYSHEDGIQLGRGSFPSGHMNDLAF